MNWKKTSVKGWRHNPLLSCCWWFLTSIFSEKAIIFLSRNEYWTWNSKKVNRKIYSYLWSTIPSISTKWTITSPLKSLNIKKTTTYNIEYPSLDQSLTVWNLPCVCPYKDTWIPFTTPFSIQNSANSIHTYFECCDTEYFGVMVMVFNVNFNIISVILWLSVLLVEETGVPGENHRPTASHWQTLSHQGRN